MRVAKTPAGLYPTSDKVNDRRRCDAVFRANGEHKRYETSKSVTVNDEFDTVKILRVCLFHWMVFNNEIEFLCLCTITLLEYDCFQR